jgi:hypothetical protein
VALLSLFVHTPPHTFGIEQGSAYHITRVRYSLYGGNVPQKSKVPILQSSFFTATGN